MYGSEVVSPQGHCFQTGGLVYDTNKAFIVTDGLISQLFVVIFVYPIYVQIAIVWVFPVQLSL